MTSEDRLYTRLKASVIPLGLHQTHFYIFVTFEKTSEHYELPCPADAPELSIVPRTFKEPCQKSFPKALFNITHPP